jgi:hypothetical protein
VARFPTPSHQPSGTSSGTRHSCLGPAPGIATRSVVSHHPSPSIPPVPSRPRCYWSTAVSQGGVGHPSPPVTRGLVAMWSQFRAAVARPGVWQQVTLLDRAETRAPASSSGARCLPCESRAAGRRYDSPPRMTAATASRRTLGTAAGCRQVPVGPPVSWTGRRCGLAEEEADELGLVFRPEGYLPTRPRGPRPRCWAGATTNQALGRRRRRGGQHRHGQIGDGAGQVQLRGLRQRGRGPDPALPVIAGGRGDRGRRDDLRARPPLRSYMG